LSNGDQHLAATSQPIQPTSKLDPIRRKIAEQSGKKAPSNTSDKKKRARSDELLEALEEIKETQREQGKMIDKLLSQMSAPIQLPDVPVKMESISLEQAIEQLLDVYNRLAENERPHKLRRIVSSLPEKCQQDTLHEVGYVFTASVESNQNAVQPAQALFESIFQPTDSLEPPSNFRDDDLLKFPSGVTLGDASCYPSTCAHSKELELWNTAIYDLLAENE